jgi:hypothetical protein
MAEYHGTLHDTPTKDSFFSYNLDQRSLVRGRDKRHLFMPSHKLAPLTFSPLGLGPMGKNPIFPPGNPKGGSITVLLTSCLTGLESAV